MEATIPRDGSGTYTRTNGVTSGPTLWQAQRDSTGAVDAPTHDTEANDIGQALTDSLAKDGQTVPIADLPMGGFKHTNVAGGTQRNHYPSIGQVQDGEINYAICTGTGDAMVAAFSPGITAVVNGQQFRVRAVAANTITTPTFTPNSGTITARTIVKAGGSALAAGDYTAGMEILLRYVSGGTPVYELLTPVQADTSTFVPSTRLISTGAGLSGGGDLSADRTLIIPTDGIVTAMIQDAQVTQAKLAANTGGRIIQVQRASVATEFTLSAATPAFDNTIPQNTEGSEIVTVAITPTNASSTIRVTISAPVSHSLSNGKLIASVFQDAIANALGTTMTAISTGDQINEMTRSFYFSAASTTARTYKLRIGTPAVTGYVNRSSAGSKFGGILTAEIVAEEIL